MCAHICAYTHTRRYAHMLLHEHRDTTPSLVNAFIQVVCQLLSENSRFWEIYKFRDCYPGNLLRYDAWCLIDRKIPSSSYGLSSYSKIKQARLINPKLETRLSMFQDICGLKLHVLLLRCSPFQQDFSPQYFPKHLMREVRNAYTHFRTALTLGLTLGQHANPC